MVPKVVPSGSPARPAGADGRGDQVAFYRAPSSPLSRSWDAVSGLVIFCWHRVWQTRRAAIIIYGLPFCRQNVFWRERYRDGRVMAGRILNRRDLRRQAELAEERAPGPAKQEGGTTSRKSSGQRGEGRVCARWGVFDGAMKLVETFDYNQRALADQRAAELNAARKNGTTYFVQVVKEAMPQPGTANLD